MADICYDPFIPTTLNRAWKWKDPRLAVVVEETALPLGELNGWSHAAEVAPLVGPKLLLREALASARLDGFSASLDDVVQDSGAEKATSTSAIVRALAGAYESLEDLIDDIPISGRLMKQLHADVSAAAPELVREPGTWRRAQIWEGAAEIEQATFIPAPPEDIARLMEDLEAFLQNDEIEMSVLVRASLALYQMETVQPFFEMNGAVARLLFQAILLETGIIGGAVLPISEVIERSEPEYRRRLSAVRSGGDLGGWIQYILNVVREAAENAVSEMVNVDEDRASRQESLRSLGRRAPGAARLLDYFYISPAITVNDAADFLGVAFQTANRFIDDFVEQGMVEEITGAARGRVFRIRAGGDEETIET